MVQTPSVIVFDQRQVGGGVQDFTDTFRVTSAGYYLVDFHAEMNSDEGGDASAAVMVGSTVSTLLTDTQAPGEHELSGSAVIYLASSSLVRLWISGGADGFVDVQPGASLTMVKLG